MLNDQYVAKESLTLPLVTVVMFGVVLYAVIRHGRTTLIIDSEGITIKEWGKTRIYYWL